MTDNISRPIVGIENRTAQEVFDIMVDRIRLASQPPQEQKRVKLPPISEELYEHYPAMSAQTHADLVKDYAREAVRAALATTEGQNNG